MSWSPDNYCTVICAGIILFASVLIKTSENGIRQNEDFETRKFDINRLPSACIMQFANSAQLEASVRT